MKKISRIVLLSAILFAAPHMMIIAQQTPAVTPQTVSVQSRLMEWGKYATAPFVITADKIANFTRINAALDYLATLQAFKYDCFVNNTHKIGSAIVAATALCAFYKIYKACSTPDIDDEDDIFLEESD